MMYASEILQEFKSHINALEARTAGLERIIASLEGIRLVFTSDVGGISKDTKRLESMIAEYIEQKELAQTEADNLRASYRDVLNVMSKLPRKYQAVLHLRFVAGLNRTDTAKRLNIDRRAATNQEAEALALLTHQYSFPQKS